MAAAVLALLVLGAVRLLRVNARRQTDGDDVLGLGQPPHDHIDAAVRDPGSERTAPAGRRGGSWRLRWLIGVSVVACVLLAFDTAVSFGYLHWGSGPSTPAPASAAQAEGFTWPAGKRPAPSFVLHDQNGRAVTPHASGGRLTILAFIDPVCRTILCPLRPRC